MRLVRTLKITRDEFFDQLEGDVRELIEGADGVEMPKRGIRQGLSVKLPETKKSSWVKLNVSSYDREQGSFELRVRTPGDLTVSTYQVSDVDGGVEVVYDMTSESFDASKKGVIHGFSEAYYLGRMSTFLQNVERNATDLRSGVTPAMRKEEAERRSGLTFVKRLFRKGEGSDAK